MTLAEKIALLKGNKIQVSVTETTTDDCLEKVSVTEKSPPDSWEGRVDSFYLEGTWLRTCQECGNKQKAIKPDTTKELTNSYRNSKCKKCKSESLDYGSEHTSMKEYEESLSQNNSEACNMQSEPSIYSDNQEDGADFICLSCSNSLKYCDCNQVSSLPHIMELRNEDSGAESSNMDGSLERSAPQKESRALALDYVSLSGLPEYENQVLDSNNGISREIEPEITNETFECPWLCPKCNFYTQTKACPDCFPKEYKAEIKLKVDELAKQAKNLDYVSDLVKNGLCLHQCPECMLDWTHGLSSTGKDNEICHHRDNTCQRCTRIRERITGRILSMLVHKDDKNDLDKLKSAASENPDKYWNERVAFCLDMSDDLLRQHIQEMQDKAIFYRRESLAGDRAKKIKRDKELVNEAENYRLTGEEKSSFKKVAKKQVTNGSSAEEKGIAIAMLTFDMTREQAERFVKDIKKK